MVLDTAMWRGSDRIFADTVARLLAVSIKAEAAMITIANATGRTVLAFSVQDGSTELVIMPDAAGVEVQRRIKGQQVGLGVTLTTLGEDRVRAACQNLLDRVKALGGLQESQDPTH